MNDTKYDSIWSSNGTWKRSTQNHELILDDTLTVDILVDVERLKIVKWLPWTGQSTCYEGVCLPIVTGIWTFEFEKAK